MRMNVYIKVKVKYPPYRPTWPRGIQKVKGSQISWHSAHEGGRVFTPTHRPSLPPGISWYSFLEAESTPGTSPVTRPGIDPGTLRLVAQRLNHYATPGPWMCICMYVCTPRVLHIGRSSASSFNFQFPLFSLMLSGSFQRLRPRLSGTSMLPSIFPSLMFFRRQFYARCDLFS